MRNNRKLWGIMVLAIFCIPCFAQNEKVVSKSFEFRYYSSSPEANGETDFKGKTEVFDTDQRFDFLNAYADYASEYFNDSGLDIKAVEKEQIQEVVSKLKPQPLTEVRRTVRLENWKSLGYRDGQIAEEKEAIANWAAYKNASVVDEQLKLAKGSIDHRLSGAMDWRFSFSWKASVSEKCDVIFMLSGDDESLLEVGFTSEGDLYYLNGLDQATLKIPLQQYVTGKAVEFKLEVDIEASVFNLYLDGERMLYAEPIKRQSVTAVDTFSITSSGELNVDDIYGLKFIMLKKGAYKPVKSTIVIDEDFRIRPNVNGWETSSYDESRWEAMTLPAAHGGLRCGGEDLYLRKTVSIGDHEKAILKFETIDPGGDIYINGSKVVSITNRWPIRLDVTKYLKKNADNLITVKVNSFMLKNPMHHACDDPYIGWFAGRCRLELTPAASVKEALVNTEMLDGSKATQRHRITLENSADSDFSGQVEIRYSPWFPKDGPVCFKKQFDVSIPAGEKAEQEFKTSLNDASLWTYKTPNLYKVQVLLKDSKGKAIDDFVLTTGVRTISQTGGTFQINGKEEMLNGVQNMGFRMPFDMMAKNNRCAPFDVLVEEMLMALNCGSNMFRLHAHAAKGTPDGIHDPRIPEMCDQLGIMLVWTGGAWIRELEWENIDFEGLPLYMKELYNYPSIVVWELSNHPNRFKSKPVQNSIDFVEKTMKAALAIDTSRLISPTTFWGHTHIKNDLGTKDIRGNTLKMPAEYTHPLCTRGSQDAVTGYGASWTTLRGWPYGLTKDCLNNKQQAFFNWEREESIAQPNWNLSIDKPWHELQSYEWGYDKGSIGRLLQTSEWRASQAFQAFSAYESTKKQRMHGVAGFSWCCIHGGANSGTYKKPIIDCLGYPKLCWYLHKLFYQRVLAGSDNVDVVYGPEDTITPVIMNLDEAKNVSLKVIIRSVDGEIVKEQVYGEISLEEGRSVIRMTPLEIQFPADGYYVIEYIVQYENADTVKGCWKG